MSVPLPFQELSGADAALLRFVLARSEVDGDCLRWRMSTSAAGYPQFNTARFGKQFAHLALWTSINGPLPQGFRLANECGCRRCVRPQHWAARTPGQIVAAQYASGARSGERLYRAAIKAHLARERRVGSFERAAQARELLDSGRASRRLPPP